MSERDIDTYLAALDEPPPKRLVNKLVTARLEQLSIGE
jgi:hypothetical protein